MTPLALFVRMRVRQLTVQSSGIRVVLFLVMVAAATEPAAILNTTSACSVSSVQFLATGGDADWSTTNNTIVYDTANDPGYRQGHASTAIYQIHTIKPDGSDDTCISCKGQGVPGSKLDKFLPFWDPSGKWIIVEVEMDKHAAQPSDKVPKLTYVLNGWWTNLWATTPTGSRWYRLTNYASGYPSVGGALYPRFSADGKKLFWSRLRKIPDAHGKLGYFDLYSADFVVDKQGTPKLQNITDLNSTVHIQGGALWEDQGVSPDGKDLIFTTDYKLPSSSPYGYDIWTMDLHTHKLVDLTPHTPHSWEEHARYSPSGNKISFTSTKPFTLYTATTPEKKSELFIMNRDGSDWQQVTHFNEPGYTESYWEPSLTSESAWSPDGSQVLITRILSGIDYPARSMWIATFKGACGGSAPNQQSQSSSGT